MLWDQFKSPDHIGKITKAIKEWDGLPVKLMEVCGTHTMAIAKSGIKSMLPENIKLLSGPGCPVCVTAEENIDAVLKLAQDKNVTIATYGDMLKVPGSVYGESLEKLRAMGANVKMVYSAFDAVEIAKENPEEKVVFLGIGFETTTPGTAIALHEAVNLKLKNFYVYSLHKLVEPVLRSLIEEEDFNVDGFLCPGNVAVITGERGFEFLPREYRIPSVICGFEAGDILTSIYKLLCQIKDNNPHIENEYTRAVDYEGNIEAQNAIKKYFEPADDLWRGMGLIKNSGLKLKAEYSAFDAEKNFDLHAESKKTHTACKCGEIIKGKMVPNSCPLFGRACTPENPVGPCMVSSEGTCAAYYKYQQI
jgi:hydrogenase expression/formation protein HypD